MWQHAAQGGECGFFVSMSSICEGVLSLVNYTRRHAREREKRWWDELRQWVWSCLLLSFNAQSLLALLAPLVWRCLNACQKSNELHSVHRKFCSFQEPRYKEIKHLPAVSDILTWAQVMLMTHLEHDIHGWVSGSLRLLRQWSALVIVKSSLA